MPEGREGRTCRCAPSRLRWPRSRPGRSSPAARLAGKTLGLLAGDADRPVAERLVELAGNAEGLFAGDPEHGVATQWLVGADGNATGLGARGPECHVVRLRRAGGVLADVHLLLLR